jgi:hypothetical protein
MGPMPPLQQLFVHLPEATCALGGGALLVLARRAQATAPLPRRVTALALLLALGGVVARAPRGTDALLSPDTLGRLGLPLLVWFSLATGAALARSRPKSARASDLAALLFLGAALLRLATWPTGDTAPLALGLALPAAAYLAWRSRRDLPAGLLGCALVALGAALAPWVDGLVWRGLISPALPAWVGAGLALALLIATLAGPQTPRRLLLGVSGAQLALLLAAAAVGTRHAMFGALAGAAWSWLAPLLALWALLSGLEESPSGSLRPLVRNRPQRIAAGLAFLALCGAPLTPGFAARVSLSEATLRAGLTGPAALGGVALALLAIVGLRVALGQVLASSAEDEPDSKEPWVFDHAAATVAAFLPWALVALELAHPGFCGGGSWGS